MYTNYFTIKLFYFLHVPSFSQNTTFFVEVVIDFKLINENTVKSSIVYDHKLTLFIHKSTILPEISLKRRGLVCFRCLSTFI